MLCSKGNGKAPAREEVLKRLIVKNEREKKREKEQQRAFNQKKTW